MRATVHDTEDHLRPAAVEERDLNAIIFELREELEASRARGDADAARAYYEHQLAQLRSTIAAMRQALEQAKADAESERQAIRAAAEAELKDLKAAVVAGRESFEAFRAQGAGHGAGG